MTKRLFFISMIVFMLVTLNAYNTTKNGLIDRVRTGQHIIIAPQEFMQLATQYSDFYWDQFQIEREVVDQQDIFDQMNGGVADPEAIRDYLVLFFDDPTIWSESSVLLMGSGTDEWNIPDDKNRIIVFEWTDDKFVLLDEDLYPDVPIGRFPAQNLDHLNVIINKNIQYITNPNFDWWQNRMLIVADDEYKNGQLEGISYTSGLNHTARSQELADSLSNAIWIDKVLGIEYTMNANGYKPDASQEIIDRLNDGRLIWHYIGHGNVTLLGDEHYFSSDQIQILTNNNKLPIFTAASSNVGKFHMLESDCLAEQLLTHEYGGVIASIAPRGASNGYLNQFMFLPFFQRILDDYENLGEAFLYSKTYNPILGLNSLLYNLLGDPLLFVNPPERDESISIIGNPATLYYDDEIEIFGQLPNSNYAFSQFKAFESEYPCFYSNTLNGVTYEVNYTKFGEPYYEEEIAVSNNNYESSFSVTSGIQTGDQARMISYVYGDEEDYVQYLYPITISEEAYSSDDPIISDRISLSNYPNPFNPSTTISFYLTTENTENTELVIYNIKGQKVKTLMDCAVSPGTYNCIWHGRDDADKRVASGEYIVKMQVNDEIVAERKILLVK